MNGKSPLQEGEQDHWAKGRNEETRLPQQPAAFLFIISFCALIAFKPPRPQQPFLKKWAKPWAKPASKCSVSPWVEWGWWISPSALVSLNPASAKLCSALSYLFLYFI